MYHIADVNYIIWKMPIALVFRLLVNHQISATQGKKMNTVQENEQISDLLHSYGDLINAQDLTTGRDRRRLS